MQVGNLNVKNYLFINKLSSIGTWKRELDGWSYNLWGEGLDQVFAND